MNSVKILHTADIHLGANRTGVIGGKAEIENTFLKIINICRSQAVDFLLIAGDLFETPFVSADLAERVICALAQIPDTIVAISPGNHDSVCSGSVYLKYDFPENVVVFTSFLEYIDFPEKNVRLWGAGFTDRFEKVPLLQLSDTKTSDMINLCVLHGEVIAEGTHSSYNPIYPSAIQKSGFDYLALGHIHKRSEVKNLGNTYYSYSGTPDATGFDEVGAMGVYIGEVSKGYARLDFAETSSRKYLFESVDITNLSNTFDTSAKLLKHLKQSYGEDFDKNLYRISLTGTIPIDSGISVRQLGDILANSLHFVELADKCDADISKIELISTETSLRGIFASKMLKKINSAPIEKQAKYKNALKLGLRAFSKGVSLNDN